jgi:hypothetical protein
MTSTSKIHPHDVGLSPAAVRKRRRSHRLAFVMISIALLTAAAGWFIYFTSVSHAVTLKDQPPAMAIIAYGFLFISSVTLVLGFWYMLRAQVERIARMVDASELDDQPATPAPAPTLACPHCRCHIDATDHFCRHCGKSLQTS